MSDVKNLYETIPEEAWKQRLAYPEIPSYISENLHFSLFDWQRTAIENLITFNALRDLKNEVKPTHLMFNMATGSGKTLVMASVILYYYKRGYRHFIFFVNQNNIIDKTENNFIISEHNKYLFKDKILIDNSSVKVTKVDKFSTENSNIQIKFTSIHQLYNDVHIEKENRTTLADLHKLDIIMLADEAHHLNAFTKSKMTQDLLDLPQEMDGKTSLKEIERKGWEHTVIELILNKNGQCESNRNVLLEFTATLPDNDAVAKKYADKIIFKFGLKEFLSKGFTKEINLISTSLLKEQRILLALLFAWYRHEIALKYGIANFKPVMLFRSKTIAESRQDYKDFLSLVDRIEADDLKFIEQALEMEAFSNSDKRDINQQGISRTEQMIAFIKKSNIGYANIADWIQQNYQSRNVIITNSKTNNTKTEKTEVQIEELLNSLEDTNNHIRAIFTVDRLTEGWDVLNLYDIVRLYQGQNTGGSTKNTPDATTKEKQLIGRGVRYYPFEYGDKLPNKRKFDTDPTHELRILEELFYHTYDEESRYISHLKDELRKDGYIRDDRKQVAFDIKPDFKKTDFFKNLLIWHNERKPNPNRKINNIKSLKSNPLKYEYIVPSLMLSEEEVSLETASKDQKRLTTKTKTKKTLTCRVKAIEKNIFNKAINIRAQKKDSLYQFKRLFEELKIDDINDLQSNYLADFTINFIVENNMVYEDIDNKHKLNAVLQLLDRTELHLSSFDTPNIGSEFTPRRLANIFNSPKIKIVNQESPSSDMSDKDWFILDNFYGTDEEQALVEFIEKNFGNLQDKYKDIYLLRNEEVLTIYDFKDGRGFQPDFLLFMTTKDKQKKGKVTATIHYQLFIEPKGNAFIGENNTFTLGKEGWKEGFLADITKKYGKDKIITEHYDNYTIIGLPFFNKNQKASFEESFIEQLDL